MRENPIAKQIKLEVADEIRRMKSGIGKFPRLAVVLLRVFGVIYSYLNTCPVDIMHSVVNFDCDFTLLSGASSSRVKS